MKKRQFWPRSREKKRQNSWMDCGVTMVIDCFHTISKYIFNIPGRSTEARTLHDRVKNKATRSMYFANRRMVFRQIPAVEWSKVCVQGTCRAIAPARMGVSAIPSPFPWVGYIV